MRTFKFIIVSLIFAAVLNLNIGACQNPPQAANSKTELAMFSVPDLTEDLAAKLSGSISTEPGVISAKPDLTNKTFEIIYEQGKITHEKLHELLKKTNPKIEFLSVAESIPKDTKSNCGKCPHKKTCPKTGKTEAGSSSKSDGSPDDAKKSTEETKTAPEELKGVEESKSTGETKDPEPAKGCTH